MRGAATKAEHNSKPNNTARRARNEKSFWENDWTIFSADNAALMRKAQAFGDKILQSKAIPDEETTVETMKVVEFAASQLTRQASKATKSDAEKGRLGGQASEKTDGLLSLDGKKDAHPMSISISTELLSTLAYKIVTFPPVFITPEILDSYLTTQTLLRRPQTIPEIFELYAKKPVPIPGSSPIRYKQPNPDGYKQAIPAKSADKALESAIARRDLDLAVSIIEASYATSAFQKRKFLSKAAPGLAGIALTPAAAGILASPLPHYFPLPDPSQLVTYATVGRVTWAPGTPLRERWLREEERAALDKVAMAWGFKDLYKRGEEEGPEWDVLKEWCGLRGMILDRTELMEGME